MAFFLVIFEHRQILGHAQRQAGTAFAAGKGALAKIRENKRAPGAEAGDEIQVRHRLAELVFLVERFDQIGLVDDVDEMARLGDAPKDFAQADAQIPIAGVVEPVRLAQIPMGALVVAGVEAAEGDERQRVVVVELPAQFRLEGERRADPVAVLDRILRFGGAPPG